MKVAICLTGHLRCWQTVFPNFKEHFIDRYNPDIFISTWNNEGYWVPTEGPMGIQEDTPLIDEAAVRVAYNPISIDIENFDDFEPLFAERAKNFPTYFHRPRNIISMFYKMGMGLQQLERHCMVTGKTYDMVIRMRPDMVMKEPMPDLDPNNFYTLAHRNHMGQGTGDMFQIGNPAMVTAFSKIGMHMEAIYSATQLLCPHVFSVAYIQALKLPWQEFNVNKIIQHTPNGQYGHQK
jgi:hypothetical protein